jgi:hypothetical protein
MILLPADTEERLFTDAGKRTICEAAANRITALLKLISDDNIFTFTVCIFDPSLGLSDTYRLKLFIRYAKAFEFVPMFSAISNEPLVNDKQSFDEFYVDAQLSHKSLLVDRQHSAEIISHSVDDMCLRAVDYMLEKEYGTSLKEESIILRDRAFELQKTNRSFTPDSDTEIYRYLKRARRDELDAMGVKVRREAEERQRLTNEKHSHKHTQRLKRKFTAPWRAVLPSKIHPGVCLTPEIKMEFGSGYPVTLRKCDDVEDVIVFLREYMRQVFIDSHASPGVIHRLRAIAEDTLSKICKDSEIYGIEIDNVQIDRKSIYRNELKITLATGPSTRTNIYIPAAEWATLLAPMRLGRPNDQDANEACCCQGACQSSS